MTEDIAKRIACELLKSEKVLYEDCLGAAQTKKDERDVWVVFFSRKEREGVLMTLPSTIIVTVDDLTSEAGIFPAL